MSIGHLTASRLARDNVLPPQEPQGLALGSRRMWEGGMTRFQKAEKESKAIYSTLILQMIT